jgi:hypothetical protein
MEVSREVNATLLTRLITAWPANAVFRTPADGCMDA